MPQRGRTQNWNTNVISPTASRLIQIPARTMAEIGTQRLEKTTALGGVATGIIKAHDADKVAGTSSTLP